MEQAGSESLSDKSTRIDETLDADFVVNQFGETVLSFSLESTAKAPAAVPATIGRYSVRGILGRGGMGAVYRGYDDQLDRQVAIKVPLRETAEQLQQLFLQEARQIAQLKHPSIVTVHDVGIDNGICYIVSEFLEGPNLNHWLHDRSVDWQEAATIVATLANALATAHARGIIHRDVKPGNVIMTRPTDGPVPVLVDFGLALSESSTGTIVGQRGTISGTPNYMSPEQARGEGHRIDGRTDIYSVGVILYRMLSGQLPFTATSVSALLQAVIHDEPRPPRQFVRGLPRELERICLKAMAKAIPDRYTTAADLADDLRGLLREHEDRLEAATATPKAVETSTRRQAVKILIADDHELSRFKLETDLKKWGHDVTAAEDGEEAWELFQKNEYSIVITDWMMPRLNGLELVKLIRAAQRADYVYIIMLTAKAEKHDIVAGMGAGADDFLTKPFHRDELQVRVRAGVRMTTLNRALSETNRRLQRGQDAAAQMQRMCLPTVMPQIPGYRFAWDHASRGQLGGDMLNVVPLDSNHVGVFVLDVTGDGVPAALLLTTLSRVMSSASDPASLLVRRSKDGSNVQIREPIEVARALNRQFGTQEGKQYFTLAYGVLNQESREFQFTTAGHPPLLLIRPGESPGMLDVDGFPIGMAPESDDFHQMAIALEPGDRLLVYSDGLPDAMNGQREVFGAARLLETVENLSGDSLDELVHAIIAELARWRGATAMNDDVSLLGLEVS